jgi:hypothetical protein
VPDDERDDEILDDLRQEAEDLEDAAEQRTTGEQGKSVTERLSDAVEDVIPGEGRDPRRQ